MKPLHKILKNMHDKYAVLFPETTAVKVQSTSVRLVKNGFPKIPADYREFLTTTDGLSFNGLELFSIEPHERDKGAFKHTAIETDAELRAGNPLLKDKLVIGQAPEILIAFNNIEQKYELLNRGDYEVLLKLPRFFDVLYYFAPEK